MIAVRLHRLVFHKWIASEESHALGGTLLHSAQPLTRLHGKEGGGHLVFVWPRNWSAIYDWGTPTSFHVFNKAPCSFDENDSKINKHDDDDNDVDDVDDDDDDAADDGDDIMVLARKKNTYNPLWREMKMMMLMLLMMVMMMMVMMMVCRGFVVGLFSWFC